MKIKSHVRQIISDKLTVVYLYEKMRHKYPQALLLESNDYHSRRNSRSFIFFDSLSTIQVSDGLLDIDGVQRSDFDLSAEMAAYLGLFEIEADPVVEKYSAIVGYSCYNSIEHSEAVTFDKEKVSEDIPTLRYDFYRNMIVMDHYHDQMYIIDNTPEGEESNIDALLHYIIHETVEVKERPFSVTGDEWSNMTDDEYREMVRKGKHHCQIGDVFQIVLARKFHTRYEGDNYALYRSLRSVNPSPYLFYFDYEDYQILGSSPEAQLMITDGVAEIHPIAGTFRRTGDDEQDAALAVKLENDPKETAEHVMLVDLARNDLSRHTDGVTVDRYKEIQYFSHVIHLVSKVTGRLEQTDATYQVFADTFPAGTLSGAPKVKAMQLIDQYEPQGRSFYGGALGMINLNGDLNHAIIIRSFLAKDGVLTRQAGAGIVIASNEESELQEVNNKLAALRTAIDGAGKYITTYL